MHIGMGDTNAARGGECLQPRCDIDAIAKKISAFDHDIADVDADPEADGTVG